VNLEGCLAEQEQSAADEDDVAPADLHSRDLEQRRSQADDPADREQQEDPHDHGGAQADDSRAVLLFGRQLPGEDADEDDVVDPEHDLQDRERQEGDPDLGSGKGFEHDLVAPFGRRGGSALEWHEA
jgi:hypothetical protein